MCDVLNVHIYSLWQAAKTDETDTPETPKTDVEEAPKPIEAVVIEREPDKDKDFRSRTPIEEDPREELKSESSRAATPLPKAEPTTADTGDDISAADKADTPPSDAPQSEASEDGATQSEPSESTTPMPDNDNAESSQQPQSDAPDTVSPKSATEQEDSNIVKDEKGDAEKPAKEDEKPAEAASSLSVIVGVPTTSKGKSKITGKTITGWLWITPYLLILFEKNRPNIICISLVWRQC